MLIELGQIGPSWVCVKRGLRGNWYEPARCPSDRSRDGIRVLGRQQRVFYWPALMYGRSQFEYRNIAVVVVVAGGVPAGVDVDLCNGTDNATGCLVLIYVSELLTILQALLPKIPP